MTTRRSIPIDGGIIGSQIVASPVATTILIPVLTIAKKPIRLTNQTGCTTMFTLLTFVKPENGMEEYTIFAAGIQVDIVTRNGEHIDLISVTQGRRTVIQILTLKRGQEKIPMIKTNKVKRSSKPLPTFPFTFQKKNIRMTNKDTSTRF